jgi:hypothetical protein
MEIVIEKRYFNVRRVHVTVLLGGDGKDCAHGVELDD